jgi:SAM-dependent methyltransferase
MSTQHNILHVDSRRWQQAQQFEFEFAQVGVWKGDDWNKWWCSQFNCYSEIAGREFKSVLEVGCGPHTNLRLIVPLIKCQHLYFEDPLIQFYLSTGILPQRGLLRRARQFIGARSRMVNGLTKFVVSREWQVDVSSSKLEELPYKSGVMDLAVCINVLDHVNDLQECISELTRVIKQGGVIIVGQDLSNEDDLVRAPESYEDIGHPMKMDEQILDAMLLNGFEYISRKVLSREEGRNPHAHYGTLLGILRKT